MRFHSYLPLAFSYLAQAIRQEQMWALAKTMSEAAHAMRYAKCGAQLEREGYWGACTCGGHTMVEVGDGNGAEYVWR